MAGQVASTPVLIALVVLLVVSVAGQMVGATNGSPELSYFSAGAFAAGLLRVAWQLNRPWWVARGVDENRATDIGPVETDVQPMLAMRNATLLAMGLGWGAASMFCVYYGTPLKWQHGWQYGTIMAAAGVALHFGSRNWSDGWSVARLNRLTWGSLVLCWGSGAAVFWLAGTGKLLSGKNDWAANVVFVAGAVVLAGVCAMWLRSARMVRGRE